MIHHFTIFLTYIKPINNNKPMLPQIIDGKDFLKGSSPVKESYLGSHVTSSNALTRKRVVVMSRQNLVERLNCESPVSGLKPNHPIRLHITIFKAYNKLKNSEKAPNSQS